MGGPKSMLGEPWPTPRTNVRGFSWCESPRSSLGKTPGHLCILGGVLQCTFECTLVPWCGAGDCPPEEGSVNREYHRWYSPALNRDMELLVFGHGGAGVLVFPTSMGRFYQYEDFGMVDTLRH